MACAKILLVKCHKKTIFSKFEPIITEPLELEYLAAMLNQKDLAYRIYDPLLEGKSFKAIYEAYKPDIVAFSGYITAVDVIKTQAAHAKKLNPHVKTIVGGVHAEINFVDFFSEAVDVVVHSGGTTNFAKLLETDFTPAQLKSIKGIAYQENGIFTLNEKTEEQNRELPDRTYFQQYKHKVKYLYYGPAALVKTAVSCPYSCSFCYCKLLNNGKYFARPVEEVIREISEIDCKYIWIVDDSFLIDRGRVLQFIDLAREHKLNKKFIAYSRADFIAGNEDIIEKLAQIGFVDLIVGMESVDDHYLNGYNKNTKADENLEAAKILRKHGINLTALFIAGIEFTPQDFKNLRKWIKRMDLKVYTISIFTPIKGLKDFEKYQASLLTGDFAKWDFLHLVIKPEKMSAAGFYFQFYFSYLAQFFTNKELIKLILYRGKKFLKLGGS